MLPGMPSRARRDSLREEPLRSLDVQQLSLLRASAAGDSARIATLLEHGNLEVNFCTLDGSSALVNAAQHGHEAVVRQLLAAGASVNPESETSHAAICGAATYGHINVVRSLLDHGANPNHRSSGSMTALMGACVNGHAHCVQTCHAT